MSFGRNIRYSGSVLLVLVLLAYVAYVTREACIRYQNIQKYGRLKEYEIEIKELTQKLNSLRSEARVVKHSLGLLKGIMAQIVEKTQGSSIEQYESERKSSGKKHPNDVR